jgi:hypothetical protein
MNDLRKVGDPPAVSFKEGFRRFYDVFRVSDLLPAFYPDGSTPRGRYSNGRGATRRGAVHKQGRAFKPRNLSGISPAEYRRRHLGKLET